MAPQTSICNSVITLHQQKAVHEHKIVWQNVVLMLVLHVSALYGIWLMLTVGKWQTVWAMYFIGMSSALGVLAGAHRLWHIVLIKQNAIKTAFSDIRNNGSSK